MKLAYIYPTIAAGGKGKGKCKGKRKSGNATVKKGVRRVKKGVRQVKKGVGQVKKGVKKGVRQVKKAIEAIEKDIDLEFRNKGKEISREIKNVINDVINDVKNGIDKLNISEDELQQKVNALIDTLKSEKILNEDKANKMTNLMNGESGVVSEDEEEWEDVDDESSSGSGKINN